MTNAMNLVPTNLLVSATPVRNRDNKTATSIFRFHQLKPAGVEELKLVLKSNPITDEWCWVATMKSQIKLYGPKISEGQRALLAMVKEIKQDASFTRLVTILDPAMDIMTEKMITEGERVLGEYDFVRVAPTTFPRKPQSTHQQIGPHIGAHWMQIHNHNSPMNQDTDMTFLHV